MITNVKLRTIWKEAATAYFQVYLSISLEGLRKATTNHSQDEFSCSHGGEYEDDLFSGILRPCSLVEVYRRFRGARCHRYHGDEQAARDSKHL
jgi:hypothetical protein